MLSGVSGRDLLDWLMAEAISHLTVVAAWWRALPSDSAAIGIAIAAITTALLLIAVVARRRSANRRAVTPRAMPVLGADRALESFRASLAIRDRLAKADPGNAGWQRDLALSHGRVARALARQGSRREAGTAFELGRTIIARLQRQAPDNAKLPEDLAWFEDQIAALDG